MKLYHVSQRENIHHDSYSDFVVCAESEEEARHTHPNTRSTDPWGNRDNTWCRTPEDVTVKYLGEASDTLEKGIVCSSFHAG